MNREAKSDEPAPAQFSYHEAHGDGINSHSVYLAEGPKDCRPELVGRMLEATKHALSEANVGADRVVMYSPYEKTRIKALQDDVPEFRAELVELEHKLVDLLPVLRENVYHRDFQGSFSLKYTLKPLVPDLSYSDLIIVDGLTASAVPSNCPDALPLGPSKGFAWRINLERHERGDRAVAHIRFAQCKVRGGEDRAGRAGAGEAGSAGLLRAGHVGDGAPIGESERANGVVATTSTCVSCDGL